MKIKELRHLWQSGRFFEIHKTCEQGLKIKNLYCENSKKKSGSHAQGRKYDKMKFGCHTQGREYNKKIS